MKRPIAPQDLPSSDRVAHQLLFGQRDRHEDNIRQDIGRLLDLFNIENKLTWRTDAGEADIYLPRRHVIIEVKKVGLADDPNTPQQRKNSETPRQQLERYLHSEQCKEAAMLPLEPECALNWIGIVTDGRIWHAWSYDNVTGNALAHLLDGKRPKTPAELVELVHSLVNRNPVGKPWIPEDPRDLFTRELTMLRDIRDNLTGRVAIETETKRRLWLDMLRTCSMEPETSAGQENLFVTHSFLVALAKGVIHTLDRPMDPPQSETILGDGFVAWIVATTSGQRWAKDFMDRIHGYDWRRQQGDILRPLYERFVDERDRKDFGEYYTPDWLAEMIVGEILDDDWCVNAIDAALASETNPTALDGVGVLDPTCGSGTFLYHAVQRILRSDAMQRQALTPARKATVAARLVNGIDVHPVAAEIARATILRALPISPQEGTAAIRVYEGDALLARFDDGESLFRPLNGELCYRTGRGDEIILPRNFVMHRSFADNLRRLVSSANQNLELPADVRRSVPEEDQSQLEKVRDTLVRVIEREGNSVWTWYIVNVTGPFLLSQRKINRIVANPP